MVRLIQRKKRGNINRKTETKKKADTERQIERKNYGKQKLEDLDKHRKTELREAEIGRPIQK